MVNLDFLANILGGGLLNTILKGIALVLMVLAVLIWIMELSGWTISRKGFVRNNVKWDATSIAILAISAAVYIAGANIKLTFLPGGFSALTVVNGLAPIFGVLFGLPGALGIVLSLPIADAISGALTLGSVAGMLSHTYLTWLPYKMVKDPSFRSWNSAGSYFLWAIIVGPILHSIIIPGWLDFTHVIPPAIAWGVVTPTILINHALMGAWEGSLLLRLLFARVKAWGLYWRDRYTEGNVAVKSKKA